MRKLLALTASLLVIAAAAIEPPQNPAGAPPKQEPPKQEPATPAPAPEPAQDPAAEKPSGPAPEAAEEQAVKVLPPLPPGAVYDPARRIGRSSRDLKLLSSR